MKRSGSFLFALKRGLSPFSVVRAHRHSDHHREEILKSGLCGCFYCLATFAPTEIVEWIDDIETAICPRCGIDSVIGSESRLPITSDFLRRMRRHWFYPMRFRDD